MKAEHVRIGIRPVIDGRWGGIREGLEEQTMEWRLPPKELIESHLRYPDGAPVECVIADGTIGGGEEAARCAQKFSHNNVCATLSVTPCWCYGSETMKNMESLFVYIQAIHLIHFLGKLDYLPKDIQIVKVLMIHMGHGHGVYIDAKH